MDQMRLQNADVISEVNMLVIVEDIAYPVRVFVMGFTIVQIIVMNNINIAKVKMPHSWPWRIIWRKVRGKMRRRS